MLARLPLAGAGLLLLLTALPSRPEEKPPAARRIDFLVLSPARPVHVRLHLEVDGQPLEQAFRTAHREQLKALFPWLDRNGDGSLDEAEARGIPLPVFQLPGSDNSDNVHIAYNFRAIDLDGDGKVTAAELASFYEEFEGGPFNVRTAPALPFAAANIDLATFNLFDADGDSKLSKQEIARAADVLRKCDRDADEIVTLPEALPQQGFRPDAPFGGQPAMPALQTASPVSLDPKRLEAFAGLTPDLELRVRLGRRKADAPTLEVIRPRAGEALSASLKQGDGEVLLTLDRVRLELLLDRTVHSARSQVTLRDHALRQFRTADADADGLVSQAEARRHPFLRDLFPVLDRKGKGKIAEADLREYCDRVLALQAQTMARRVTLLASQGVLGLWDVLDRNRDGVLGLREIRRAPAILASLDRNGDGLVERDEIPAVFALQLGVGQTDFRRLSGDEVVAFGPDGRLAYSAGTAGGGPVWFRKMDRNGDGDVSRTEFLGPPEAFRKLDLDGDGLISREEAEQGNR